MTTERWQEVKQLFASAVACAANDRASFLARECGEDEELRQEAQRLLSAHENSGDFIETPAFDFAPELLGDDPDALLGQHLGAYRIEAVLGAGGMGVVYLAYDERLERKVALKLLPPWVIADEPQLQRLQREARTASALNHPNIVTIHEIGAVDSTHFIATEFIEGVTLRERLRTGPIPCEEALEIAIQIGSAVRVAHRAGIVHRDVKPENIMLRPDGIVKVLDFGIAALERSALSAERIGTAHYMSPEQTRGEAVDPRSDLWSFGVVLSEILGSTPAAALQRIVDRCLRADPAARYHTADQLLVDLRAARENTQRTFRRYVPWIALSAAAALIATFLILNQTSDAPLPKDKSIAVLPFENLSADAGSAFLADGIHDDVVTSLSKIKDLKVIARGSVMAYRGAAGSGKLRDIARSLGVAHLLQGSVRRADNRIVVNVALVDARNQQQQWAQRYERTLSDTIPLQGELALEIARALHASLTPGEATLAAAKPTENPEAYLLYLRARGIDTIAFTAEPLEAAAQLYEQALELDPNFALARARLSLCAIRLFEYTDSPEWKMKALSEAEEALRSRPALGEAHLALTHYYLSGEEDYDRALAELARTAELLPNSAEVPLTAAFIYKRQNRFRDRLTALQRAETLDPRNLRVLAFTTNTRRWVREWREAMQAFDKLSAVAPHEPATPWRWWRVSDEFQLTGDIETLKRALARPAEVGLSSDPACLNYARYETAMLERDYTQAAQHLAAIAPEKFEDVLSFLVAHPKVFHEALVAVATNADAGARQRVVEAARSEAEARLSQQSAPGREIAHTDLALIEAFLGRKNEAIREALRGVELARAGSVERNDASAALAMVYANTGEPEKAIDLIEHLLTVATDVQRGAIYNMTLTDLKWRWQWDPLRRHPRFQKLLASPEPKTVY